MTTTTIDTAIEIPDHLRKHRRMILWRSLLGGLAGLIPVPLLDDYIARNVLQGTLRKIAEARGVDIDAESLKAVMEGKVSPPSWRTLLTTAPIVTRRSLRRVLVLVNVASRADEVTRLYGLATLFDHYCTRVHVGAAIETTRSRQLRAAMDEALGSSRYRFLANVVGRGLLGAGKAALRAPVELANLATGGWLRRRLKMETVEEPPALEPEAVDSLERQAPAGFLGRTFRAVEDELGTVGDHFAGELVAAFEKALPGQPKKT